MVGVNYEKTRDRWMARVTVDGNRLLLGRYRTEEEATRALLDFKDDQRTPFSDGFSFEETPIERMWRSWDKSLLSLISLKIKNLYNKLRSGNV